MPIFDIFSFFVTIIVYNAVNEKAKEWRRSMKQYGEEQANKYGKLISEKLSGKTISKNKALAEQPGGLIYEAELLKIDMWELLEALEGMCDKGTATEINDSTYLVK